MHRTMWSTLWPEVFSASVRRRMDCHGHRINVSMEMLQSDADGFGFPASSPVALTDRRTKQLARLKAE